MRRRTADEMIERFRSDRDVGLSEINRRCARWVLDNVKNLTEADPSVPSALNDRAADNWRPLFAIADAIGGEVPALARQAASALTPGEEASLGGTLLVDIRGVFEADGCEQITSKDLCQALVGLSDRPWPEAGRGGKPLTERGLASRLRPFSVKPRTLRFGPSSTKKGYRMEDFAESFKRYVPRLTEDPQNLSVTPSQLNDFKGLGENRSVTPDSDVTDREARNSLESQDCYDVTDRNGAAADTGNSPASSDREVF